MKPWLGNLTGLAGPGLASFPSAGVLPGAVLAGRQADPETVKNAFESLLLGELLKPIEQSLRAGGLFPQGAPGEIYSHLWKTQMSDLLAKGIDLFPGWEPFPEGEVSSGTPPVGLRGWKDPSCGQAPSTARLVAPFEPLIRAASRLTGVGANWLRAVIIQESGGRPDAVSAKGAVGLMQLLPTTAAALGVSDPLDPGQNVSAGARYLGSLMRRFGDPKLALAAYNAGPSRVEACGALPPFRETRRYVQRVLELKGEFDRYWPADAGHDAGPATRTRAPDAARAPGR